METLNRGPTDGDTSPCLSIRLIRDEVKKFVKLALGSGKDEGRGTGSKERVVDEALKHALDGYAIIAVKDGDDVGK